MAYLASDKRIENKIVLKFIVHQLKTQYSVYAALETAVRYENNSTVTGCFFFFSVCLFICLLVFARGVKTLGKCNKGKAFIGHVLSQFREYSFCRNFLLILDF